jgi:hypothetical protein
VRKKDGRGVNRGGKEEGREWGVLFWNVAGLNNKDREFWRELGKWEIVVLVEMWLDEAG